mgnify:CR=1 FL=1
MVGGQRPFLYQLYLPQKIGDQFTLTINPGGTGDIDNAVVIGAQFGFTF